MTNVIPFRRKPGTGTTRSLQYLAALMTVIEGLAYPSIVMLFSGALLHIWQAKNGGDRKATLDDLNGSLAAFVGGQKKVTVR